MQVFLMRISDTITGIGGKKMAKIILAAWLVFLLVSCGGVNIPIAVTTPFVSPSRPPAIYSPTPPFVPSTTWTMTVSSVSPSLAPTSSITPTGNFTSTQTPGLVLDIVGCNTSLDITHGMGEVTNAYPIIRNNTGADLTNICATLSATDEGRVHPDKTACIASLPAKYQVTLKLTVDTGFRQDTSIQVDVNTTEGYTASITQTSCRDIGLPGWVSDKAGIIEPIP
jgi:hypothetical protein